MKLVGVRWQVLRCSNRSRLSDSQYRQYRGGPIGIWTVLGDQRASAHANNRQNPPRNQHFEVRSP
jgi:hypothetical protein